jgi:hypothetical protein
MLTKLGPMRVIGGSEEGEDGDMKSSGDANINIGDISTPSIDDEIRYNVDTGLDTGNQSDDDDDDDIDKITKLLVAALSSMNKKKKLKRKSNINDRTTSLPISPIKPMNIQQPITVKPSISNNESTPTPSSGMNLKHKKTIPTFNGDKTNITDYKTFKTKVKQYLDYYNVIPNKTHTKDDKIIATICFHVSISEYKLHEKLKVVCSYNVYCTLTRCVKVVPLLPSLT